MFEKQYITTSYDFQQCFSFAKSQLLQWAYNTSLQQLWDTQINTYSPLFARLPEQWINDNMEQYLLFNICSEPEILQKILLNLQNHHILYEQFLQHSIMYPWELCIFELPLQTQITPDHLYEIYNILNQQSYTIYSPLISEYVKKKYSSFWGCLLFTGEQYEFVNIIHRFNIFTGYEIMLFAHIITQYTTVLTDALHNCIQNFPVLLALFDLFSHDMQLRTQTKTNASVYFFSITHRIEESFIAEELISLLTHYKEIEQFRYWYSNELHIFYNIRTQQLIIFAQEQSILKQILELFHSITWNAQLQTLTLSYELYNIITEQTFAIENWHIIAQHFSSVLIKLFYQEPIENNTVNNIAQEISSQSNFNTFKNEYPDVLTSLTTISDKEIELLTNAQSEHNIPDDTLPTINTPLDSNNTQETQEHTHTSQNNIINTNSIPNTEHTKQPVPVTISNTIDNIPIITPLTSHTSIANNTNNTIESPLLWKSLETLHQEELASTIISAMHTSPIILISRTLLQEIYKNSIIPINNQLPPHLIKIIKKVLIMNTHAYSQADRLIFITYVLLQKIGFIYHHNNLVHISEEAYTFMFSDIHIFLLYQQLFTSYQQLNSHEAHILSIELSFIQNIPNSYHYWTQIHTQKYTTNYIITKFFQLYPTLLSSISWGTHPSVIKHFAYTLYDNFILQEFGCLFALINYHKTAIHNWIECNNLLHILYQYNVLYINEEGSHDI